jgi:hypothetical protein
MATTVTADMDEIKDSLMEVMSIMADLTLQFNEMPSKEVDATITNCLKYKVPPAVMISLYQLGTQISSLRTLRWNLYMRNEKVRETTAAITVISAPESASAPAGDPLPVASQAEEEEAVSTTKVNAYHKFVKEMRPVIAKENPEMTPQEIIKELGRRWAILKTASVSVPVVSSSSATTEINKSDKEPETPTAEAKKRGGGKKATESKSETAAAAAAAPAPVPVPEPAHPAKKTATKKAAAAPEPAPAPVSAPAPAAKNTASKKAAAAPEPAPEPALAPAVAPAVAPAPAAKKTAPKKAAAAPEPAPVPPTAVAAPTLPLPTTKEVSSSDSDDDGKTKKKKAIPKYIKTLVWNQYVGEHRAEACCSCCRKTQINVRHFHCGHVIAEAKGGDSTLNNLRPICSNCNLAMGTMSMNEFADKFFGWKVT